MDSIVLDRRLFKPQKARRVKVYCLDRNCIGIATEQISSWKNVGFNHFSILPKRVWNGDYRIIFPKRVQRFYCMQQPETQLTASYSQDGKTVLVTINDTGWDFDKGKSHK